MTFFTHLRCFYLFLPSVCCKLQSALSSACLWLDTQSKNKEAGAGYPYSSSLLSRLPILKSVLLTEIWKKMFPKANTNRKNKGKSFFSSPWHVSSPLSQLLGLAHMLLPQLRSPTVQRVTETWGCKWTEPGQRGLQDTLGLHLSCHCILEIKQK